MEILSLIGPELLKKLVLKSFELIQKEVSSQSAPKLSEIINTIPDRLEIHSIELIKWSSTIPLIGYNNPEITEESTIELMISSNFEESGKTKTKNTLSEEDIIQTPHNSLIVGHPGSGKTTTIKRILLKFFLDHSEETPFAFPILIRLRYLRKKSISQELLSILNIQSHIVIEEESYLDRDENGKKIHKVRKHRVPYVGEDRLDDFIPKLLNSGRFILFLDGLDEVETATQESIFREIENIGMGLTTSKITLTVRKTKLFKIIHGFRYYEIKPLNKEKILSIANKWLINGEDFLKEIDSKPYKDLANRPIFLTFLLILFRRLKTLPHQPNEIYKEATYLILKDWDEQRDIIRTSKYSDFGPRKKLRFLCEISYYLTYKVQTKVFSSKDLLNIYESIHAKYSLPQEDMNTVIAEIESHNGIITEADFNLYEFSHLSIQEYLCAEHIVTIPFSQNTIDYFYEYPEPLAIAVCISGDPSEWFANLILNNKLGFRKFRNSREKESFTKSLFSLITRLNIESPLFNKSKELGYSILYLIFEFHEVHTLLHDFLKNQNTKESLAIAVSEFKILEQSKTKYHIKRSTTTRTKHFIELPYVGFIPTEFMDLINSYLIDTSS